MNDGGAGNQQTNTGKDAPSGPGPQEQSSGFSQTTGFAAGERAGFPMPTLPAPGSAPGPPELPDFGFVDNPQPVGGEQPTRAAGTASSGGTGSAQTSGDSSQGQTGNGTSFLGISLTEDIEGITSNLVLLVVGLVALQLFDIIDLT
jgi:hypothetical protein